MLKSLLGVATVTGATMLAGCSERQTIPDGTPARAADTNSSQEAASMNDSSTAEDSGLLPLAASDAEWQKRLTPEQFHVTRRKGTERAFTGALWNNHQTGLYRCV